MPGYLVYPKISASPKKNNFFLVITDGVRKLKQDLSPKTCKINTMFKKRIPL
jgi:hypothetical protein